MRGAIFHLWGQNLFSYFDIQQKIIGGQIENTKTYYNTVSYKRVIHGSTAKVLKSVCAFKYFATKVLDYATLLNYMVQFTCFED